MEKHDMYKSMKTTTFLLVLLAVTGGTVYAGQEDTGQKNHQERSPGLTEGHGLPGFIPERMIERLGLDDVQAQSVRNVMEAARPEFDALRERGRSLRASLRDLDPEEPSYGARLQDLSTDSAQVAADLVLLTGRVRAGIHAILTPEQRQSLADMAARFEGRRGRGPQVR
jgi:Spy/CpxP family protein refolding chaperone